MLIGPPKGVNVSKLSAAMLIGPPPGVSVTKLSAALITKPVGAVVFNQAVSVRTRVPKGAAIYNLGQSVRMRPRNGALIFNQAVSVRVSPPRSVFRSQTVSGYAAIIFSADPKLKGFQSAAFAALKPPAEFIRKTSAYISLERIEILARKISGAVALEPASSRTAQLSGYAALSTFPFFLRSYATIAFVTLKYVPPIGVYSLNMSAALKVRPPIITFRAGASVAMVEPRIHLQKLNQYAVVEAHRARVDHVVKYATLEPRPYEMFPRKIAGYATVNTAPPLRWFKANSYAVIAFPDPVLWTWKASGAVSLQALPPAKVRQLNMYLSVSVPPPVFLYRFGGYVTLLPKPTGMLPFKVNGAVVLAADPPHLFQVSGLATLVPLGSIGERSKKTAAYATLTPGTPVASTLYPTLVVT